MPGRDTGPIDLSDVALTWRHDGFVILPGFLAGPELEAAQAELPAVYPSATDYHASPADGANRDYTGDEFAGIIAFPFPTVALCQLAVHPKLVALAEAIFDTDDICVYASELWAKYSGAANYEQELHRDYPNHTLLVPSTSEFRWRGLEMFIWLNDVPEDHGPTHIVPLPATIGVPAMPHGYSLHERPDFYTHEVSSAGPAGTVVAYSTDTFHRGTNLTAPDAARYSAHVSYRRGDNHWTSRQAWAANASHPHWQQFINHASLKQLLLFGFPPPRHPYWTPETVEGLGVRYPGLDISPWRP